MAPSGEDWRPRKYEFVFLALALVSLVLFQITGLSLSLPLAKGFLIKTVEFTLGIYALSLVVIGYKLAKRIITGGGQSLKATASSLLTPYFTLGFLQLTLRRVGITFGVFYFFLHLKHIILLVHKATYDPLFWSLDRIIHFGIQPNIWMMNKFGQNHNAAIFLDWLYIKYFTFMLLGSIPFYLEIGGRKLAERYVFSFCLLWALGGLSYFIMPADGPCYAALLQSSVPAQSREHILQLPNIKDFPPDYRQNYELSKIWIAKTFQQRLWMSRKAHLIDGGSPGMFYGIAAMPSMHVAAVVLMAMFLYLLNPVLGALGGIYALAMFAGSIFLQWHYAVDGYVGAIMAVLVFLLSARLFGKRSVIN
jgi:hypothetical protein